MKMRMLCVCDKTTEIRCKQSKADFDLCKTIQSPSYNILSLSSTYRHLHPFSYAGKVSRCWQRDWKKNALCVLCVLGCQDCNWDMWPYRTLYRYTQSRFSDSEMARKRLPNIWTCIHHIWKRHPNCSWVRVYVLWVLEYIFWFFFRYMSEKDPFLPRGQFRLRGQLFAGLRIISIFREKLCMLHTERERLARL